MASDRERPRYAVVNLTGEQLSHVAEGLKMLRLYQQGFVDVDGRAKLTAIKKLERRIEKWRERFNDGNGDGN